MYLILTLTVLIGIVLKVISKLTIGRCKSYVCLNGKTALITGGTGGLGLETAKALAARGCRVIIADVVDCTAAKKEIIKETHNSNIVTKHVDFTSFKSIRAFAEDINKTEERLDILINNAGLGYGRLTKTEDGNNYMMQVNLFGHFLLTHLLLDLLKKSAPSRIIGMSSLAAYTSDFTMDKIHPSEEYCNKWKIASGLYGNSKYCLAAFSKELAIRLEGTGVTSNVLHPGGVQTNIFQKAYKNDGFIGIKLLNMINLMFGKNIEEGIQTTLHLATSDDVRNVSGEFFWDCIKFIQPIGIDDANFRKQIWNKLEEIVKLNENEKILPK